MRRRTLTAAFLVVLAVLGSVVVLAQKPEPPSRTALPPVERPNPPLPAVSPAAEDPFAGSPPPLGGLSPSNPGNAAAAGPQPSPLSAEVPQPASLPALVPQPSPLAATPPALVDPMQDVDEFVTQNRKRAAESIEKLTREAEELRARLRKVEMALERWKTLAGALGSSPAAPPPAEAPTLPPVEPPTASPVPLPPPSERLPGGSSTPPGGAS